MRTQLRGRKSKVSRDEHRYRMTLKALDEVTSGRLHGDAEIKARAQNLGKAKRLAQKQTAARRRTEWRVRRLLTALARYSRATQAKIADQPEAWNRWHPPWFNPP